MADEKVTPESQVPSEQAPQTEQPAAQQEEQWLTIGERTYDKDAAQKKIVHADSHIQTLEQELEEARRRLEEIERSRKQDMLEEAWNKPQQPVQEQKTEDPVTPAVDIEQLEARLFERMEKRTQEQTAAKTFEESLKAAEAKYGSSYQQRLKELADANDLTKEDVAQLASTKPKVFRQLFGLTDVKVPVSQRVPDSTSVPSKVQSDDDPIRLAARAVVSSKSSRERTDAIRNALADALKR